MTTISDSLWTAINTANSGDTIPLATGDYGDFWVPAGKQFNPPITITPASGAVPVFTSFGVGGTGFILDGLEVQLVPTTQYGINIEGGNNIVVQNCKVNQKDNLTPNGVGIWSRNCDGVTIQNCTLSSLGAGTGGIDNSNVIVTSNNYSNIGTDFNIYLGMQTASVTHNTFKNCNNATGGHPDAIQFADSQTPGTVPNTNITITDNFIEEGTGDPYQGIFIEGGSGYTIARNAILGGLTDGISLSGTQASTISDNLLQGYPDGHGGSVLMRSGTSNITINDTWGTVAPSVTGDVPQPTRIVVMNTVSTNPMLSTTDYTTYNKWKSQVNPVSPPVIIVPPVVVDPLQAQVDQLTAQVKTLSSQVAALETQNTTLTTQNNTLTIQVATDKTQITKLQTKISNAIAALNAP